MRSPFALAAVLALAGCMRIVVHQDPRVTAVETLEVEAAGAKALGVKSSAGNIRLAAAEGGTAVKVVATKSARSEEDLARVHVFARVEGEEVLVGYTLDPGVDGAGVSFAVEAPPMARVRLETSAGNLSAAGMAGELALETSAGNILVEGADGTVNAKSSAGNVRVAGRLRGNCRVDTSAGNLDVAVPAGSRLNVCARTSAGNARSEHDVEAQREFARATIIGTLGDGSEGGIEMNTSAGNISLRKLP
jgi:hypothetical protein